MLLLRFVFCVCFCFYVFVIYIVSFADVFVFVGVVCCAFVFSLLFHVLSSFCSFSLSPRLSIKSLLAFFGQHVSVSVLLPSAACHSLDFVDVSLCFVDFVEFVLQSC